MRSMTLMSLLGFVPRHVIDVPIGSLPLPDVELQRARERLTQAVRASIERSEELERQVHELTCIEEEQLTGTFRRLMAIAVLAADVDDHVRRKGERESWDHVLATHRAVEEQWTGGTHDLSNCLATLTFLPATGLNRDRALGTWIWLNLGASGRSLHFRWVVSTRRFEAILVRPLLTRFQESLQADEPDEAHPQVSPITAARAREIAEAHLRATPLPRTTGRASEVVRWDQIDWRKPLVWGKEEDFWKQHWVVYLEKDQPPEGFVLGSSLIIAVHERTGEIGYAGSANDEG
jgi:hypothetical protein